MDWKAYYEEATPTFPSCHVTVPAVRWSIYRTIAALILHKKRWNYNYWGKAKNPPHTRGYAVYSSGELLYSRWKKALYALHLTVGSFWDISRLCSFWQLHFYKAKTCLPSNHTLLFMCRQLFLWHCHWSNTKICGFLIFFVSTVYFKCENLIFCANHNMSSYFLQCLHFWNQL